MPTSPPSGGSSAASLNVQEADGSPSVNNVSILKVSNGTLTDNGSGTVTITNSAASLTVEEVDANPTVSGVSLIKVTNGTLTDNGGGSVTITTGGGGSINVKEVDGTPNVATVTILRVANGTLTDDGGGQVTLDNAAAAHAFPGAHTYSGLTDGHRFVATGATTAAFEEELSPINFIIDGGGAAITTGVKGEIEIPFGGVITAARIYADTTGSIVVDVNKAAYSGLPTFSSITASAKPTLSSAQKNQDTTLTGWTTTITAGDWLQFEVDSASTVTRVTVSLTVRRT